MRDEHIQYEKRGPIGFVKFNRPDKRNAFTIEMFGRVAEVFTEADSDTDVRCIVVHAEGTDTTTGLDLMNVVPSFRAGEVPIGNDEPGKQLDRATALAEVIAAQAPLAVQAALAHAQSALLDGWRKAIGDLVPVQRELINSEDAMEAATAMMQRRTPTFKGR
jgi:enoyl-CoA hydratase/carnithine racemase